METDLAVPRRKDPCPLRDQNPTAATQIMIATTNIRKLMMISIIVTFVMRKSLRTDWFRTRPLTHNLEVPLDNRAKANAWQLEADSVLVLYKSRLAHACV